MMDAEKTFEAGVKLLPSALGEGVITLARLVAQEFPHLSYDKRETVKQMAFLMGRKTGAYLAHQTNNLPSWIVTEDLLRAFSGLVDYLYEETEAVATQSEHVKIMTAWKFLVAEVQRLDFQPPAVIRPVTYPVRAPFGKGAA